MNNHNREIYLKEMDKKCRKYNIINLITPFKEGPYCLPGGIILNIKMPIYNFLHNHKQKKAISFHMPGHKGGRGFDGISPEFYNMGPYDITEIEGADNLHHSEGIIEEAQVRAAKLYNSKHTFFLINGTTAGIYSMILSSAAEGDKIIVPRNCHKSVINAAIIGGLRIVYLYPEVDNRLSIATTVSVESVQRAVREHPDAKAVLITYPNYYGMACDIEKIAQVVHGSGMILLTDSAHGAHFKFHRDLPICALEAGADAVAHSTHKTLSSFTQSSMLHINSNRIDINRVKFFLQLTQSTSPSYMLMASLDQARMLMEQRGEELLGRAVELSRNFRKRVTSLDGVCCIDKDSQLGGEVNTLDQTRLVINIQKTGLSPREAEYILREKYNINIEFSDLYNLVCIASIFNTKEDFDQLYDAVKDISQTLSPDISRPVPVRQWVSPETVYSPREAVYKSTQSMALKDSAGRISGEFIVPYPPGIPLVVPGELISRECIDIIKEYKENGISITGLSDKSLNYINIIT